MKKIFFLSIIILILFPSCATVFSGVKQSVNIQTDVPGAKIFVAGEAAGITPAQLKIKRNTKFIELKKEGYEDNIYKLARSTNGWYWLSVGSILISGIGIPAVIIDLADGAAWSIPENIFVEMKKK